MATSGDAHEGVHNLLDQKSFTEARSQPGVMVLDAFATWCAPCKMIAPKVVEFSKQYEHARFYKVDVDELPDVAQELEIRAMPTFVIFKDGDVVDTIVGANPKALEDAIKKTLPAEE